MKTHYIFFWITMFFTIDARAQYTIALCVVATGKYIQFIEPLLSSAKTYFCPRYNRKYIIFTDNKIALQKQDPSLSVQYVYQKKLGWPYDTLLRFNVYLTHKALFKGVDYIFATDADMLFVDYMSDEILDELVATQHPGHEGKYPLWGKPEELSYETNHYSTAYIAPEEGTHYFAGGFYGGSHDAFFSMMEILMQRIHADLAKNYIAVWHDESHLNRYFIDYPPTTILDRSYCYPEHGNTIGYPPCKPKLLALDKDHASIR